MNESTPNSPVIIVTGGAGYIGSHACKALSRAGYTPVTFDNLSQGHRELVKWGPLEEGDLRDAPRVEEVLREHRPSAVMHFAALSCVGESVEQPGRYWENNVEGSRNLLEAMAATGCRKLIFSSTCAIYGLPEQVPIPDSHPWAPVNPYGETKLQIEKMIAGNPDLNFVKLRYFNAAGADPECETGECHDPETHLVPLTLQVAAGKRDHLHVFGNDYPTPDGTCIRDYIHVIDLVDAHLRALYYLEEGGESSAFNLANGQGYSVLEVIESARRVTGHAVPVKVADRREGDPPVLVGDASRAASILGWRPMYPHLDDIIESAWRFHNSEVAAQI